MNILLIKLSSLGDVIHTLPALTDAARVHPQLRVTWVVEEAFAEIPSWHPTVQQVIPAALRRWRKQPFNSWRNGEWREFTHTLRQQHYDYVIDAQGLLKSAWLSRYAHGTRHGLDWASCREPLASLAYQQRYAIVKQQHAVTRLRQLFASIFAYPVPQQAVDYGIAAQFKATPASAAMPTLVLLHGTTWASKHWYDSYWQQLAQYAVNAGWQVQVPWGNTIEEARAQHIARVHPAVHVLPKSNLHALAQILANATAVVGVDTGLAHLAAALGTPCVSLYGATQPAWTGTFGRNQQHLQAEFTCSPCLQRQCNHLDNTTQLPSCYQSLPPDKVWQAVQDLVRDNPTLADKMR